MPHASSLLVAAAPDVAAQASINPPARNGAAVAARPRRRALSLLLACALPMAGCYKREDHASRSEGAAATYQPALPPSVTAAAPSPTAPPLLVAEPVSAEAYKDYGRNPWVDTKRDALSTFAADVDTASYTLVQRKLVEGHLPPAAAVRVEEFVNAFRYQLPLPGAEPFAVTVDATPSPLAPERHIVRVAVATRAKTAHERKPMNLVFLVDTSGSMRSVDKLGLAQQALRILVENLQDGDTVALTTYAGSSQVVLPSTSVQHRERILAAIDELQASGSTAMGSGIDLAYREAAKHARPGVASRVVVLSDGDANVGPNNHEELLKIIAEHAHRGVALSTIGFGVGNYKDELMEQLADRGDGNNYYIATLAQARRVFQDQLGATLEVVARDVKFQVSFDPSQVARYRLLGYENRDIADVEFRNDQVDGGEIGAGHQVTALYEVELTAAGQRRDSSWLTVHARYKPPGDEGMSAPALELAVPMSAAAVAPSFAAASVDLRFAVAVAAFAELLRGGEGARALPLSEVRKVAAAASEELEERRELVGLIDRALALQP